MRKNGDSLMLLELALAILFFALSAAVILQVFAGTHQKSVESETLVMSTFLAEDVVNAFQTSDESVAAFFKNQGYEENETGFENKVIVNGCEYIIAIESNLTQGSHGSLDQGSVRVEHLERPVIEIPFARFTSKGVLQ